MVGSTYCSLLSLQAGVHCAESTAETKQATQKQKQITFCGVSGESTATHLWCCFLYVPIQWHIITIVFHALPLAHLEVLLLGALSTSFMGLLCSFLSITSTNHLRKNSLFSKLLSSLWVRIDGFPILPSLPSRRDSHKFVFYSCNREVRQPSDRNHRDEKCQDAFKDNWDKYRAHF